MSKKAVIIIIIVAVVALISICACCIGTGVLTSMIGMLSEASSGY